MVYLSLYVNYSFVKIHWRGIKPSGCFSSDYAAPKGSLAEGGTLGISENEQGYLNIILAGRLPQMDNGRLVLVRARTWVSRGV